MNTAFIHGNLDDEIYMTQSNGFKAAGKDNWVCKLQRSLEGLKQSRRQWYLRFDKFMKEQKFYRSQFDHCVYFH